MSNQDPGPASSTEELQISGRVPRSRTGSMRRPLGGLVAAAVAAAAVGAGVWAWQAWATQGAQPAEALPGDTLAYLSLDLDPPGGQKVAAFSTLRKFPSLRQELGLDSVDEIRGSVVEELSSDSGCDLNYDDDVKPWIGDRFAFAVVAQKRPEPVVVLQVEDADQARAVLKATGQSCDEDFGYAVDGEWAVLARNSDVATQVVDDTGRGTLDADPEFRALTDAAGDPGLVTVYAAPEAGAALLEAIEKDPFVGFIAVPALNAGLDPLSSFLAGMGAFFMTTASFDEGAGFAEEPIDEPIGEVSPKLRKQQEELEKKFERFDELTAEERSKLIREQDRLSEKMFAQQFGEESPEGAWSSFDEEETYEGEYSEDDYFEEFPAPELPAGLRESLEDFSGLGGVARFEDDGLEVEVVTDSLEGTYADLYAGTEGGDLVSTLPEDTAIAFGAGLSDRWADKLIGQLARQFPFAVQTDAETAEAFEEATGLAVPDDLEDLGGDAISMVAGSGFSPDQLFDDPAKAPVAVRISGDADRVEAALAKLRNGIGNEGAAYLLSRRAGDYVVVGPNAAYLDHLVKGGDDLGGSDRFREVAPRADDATAVYFLDFDAGDWLAKLAEADGDRANAEPLDAVGMTVTKEEGEQRILLRLGFDD